MVLDLAGKKRARGVGAIAAGSKPRAAAGAAVTATINMARERALPARITGIQRRRKASGFVGRVEIGANIATQGGVARGKRRPARHDLDDTADRIVAVQRCRRSSHDLDAGHGSHRQQRQILGRGAAEYRVVDPHPVDHVQYRRAALTADDRGTLTRCRLLDISAHGIVDGINDQRAPPHSGLIDDADRQSEIADHGRTPARGDDDFIEQGRIVRRGTRRE